MSGSCVAHPSVAGLGAQRSTQGLPGGVDENAKAADETPADVDEAPAGVLDGAPAESDEVISRSSSSLSRESIKIATRQHEKSKAFSSRFPPGRSGGEGVGSKSGIGASGKGSPCVVMDDPVPTGCFSSGAHRRGVGASAPSVPVGREALINSLRSLKVGNHVFGQSVSLTLSTLTAGNEQVRNDASAAEAETAFEEMKTKLDLAKRKYEEVNKKAEEAAKKASEGSWWRVFTLAIQAIAIAVQVVFAAVAIATGVGIGLGLALITGIALQTYALVDSTVKMCNDDGLGIAGSLCIAAGYSKEQARSADSATGWVVVAATVLCAVGTFGLSIPSIAAKVPAILLRAMVETTRNLAMVKIAVNVTSAGVGLVETTASTVHSVNTHVLLDMEADVVMATAEKSKIMVSSDYCRKQLETMLSSIVRRAQANAEETKRMSEVAAAVCEMRTKAASMVGVA